MDTLLTYIGPIGLLCLIVGYSLFQSKQKKQAKKPSKPACPKCRSHNLTTYTPEKAEYDMRAGMVGYAIDEMDGAMTAMLYEADKTYYHCLFCGHRFSKKENRYLPETE